MSSTANAFEPGTRVEVRSSLDQRWGRGFEVVDVSGDACTVRRLSDGAVLPTEFGLDQVRPERSKKDMWWFA
ncbi:MAG: hypothetical protein ACR2H3_08925 [Acidimicrobiales bacterium]